MNRPPNLTIWWSVFMIYFYNISATKTSWFIIIYYPLSQELTASLTFTIFEPADVELDFFITTLHLYL